MIKFKKINSKKIMVVMLSCFVLTQTGCSLKQNEVSQKEFSTNTKVEQTINDLNDNMKKNKTIEEIVPVETKEMTTQKAKDEYIVEYFEKASNKMNEILESETMSNIKAKSKTIFVGLVDFIYYNGKINGITFDELSLEAKEKVLNTTIKIDSKIEKKVPGYKDKIKDKSGKAYNFTTEKLKNGKDYLEEKIEEKIGEEKYYDIKKDVKESTSKAKESTKEILETGKQKLKTWYEGWK